MDAIFLVNSKEKVNQVYLNEKVCQNLKDLIPIEVYTKEEIFKNEYAFISVKYIFSTWYMPIFTELEIRKYFPELEVVFYAAGSVKYFAEPFLKCGVKVYSAANANGIPVAEFTVAQILLANKGYFQAMRTYRKPFFKLSYKKAHQYVSEKTGNYNVKVGLIGAGTVGKKVVELLHSYDMEIYITDPFISDKSIISLGAKKVELSELFSICDVISNHLPDIPESRRMLNYSLFSRMKIAATFINTGRGSQIVEKDLIRALKEKPNRCALLDVSSHEPIWPWSSLNFTKNVFTTPHIAGSVCQEEHRMAEYIYDAYRCHTLGRENSCEVKLEMITKMT